MGTGAGTGHRDGHGRITPDGDWDESGDINEGSNRNRNGNRDGITTGNWTRIEREGEEQESFGIRHSRKEAEWKTRYYHRIWHNLCRQEVAPAGSQQLLAQDPVPARRCGI